MDKKTFIPPGTERIKNSVSDYDLLDEAVNCYFETNYKGMKGFILEYGEETFFTDLAKYLDAGYWRNPGNRYYTFRGMTIAFFKIYN